MKAVVDNYFSYHLNKYPNFFVIAADMGFFSARKYYKNFKDLGNREEAVGSVVMGLLDSGADVVIYECSGFILRKLLNDLQFYLPYSKGTLKIISYGSGFAYNKSGNGHYPFDDLHIAKLLGLDIYIPSCKHELTTMLPLISLMSKHSFIRIHDNDKCICCSEIAKDFSEVPDLPYLIIPGNLTPFFKDNNEKLYNIVTYGDQCSVQEFEKYSDDKQKFKVYNSVIVEDQKPFILLGSDIKRFSCDYSINYWHDNRNDVLDKYLPRKEIYEYLETL